MKMLEKGLTETINNPLLLSKIAKVIMLRLFAAPILKENHPLDNHI